MSSPGSEPPTSLTELMLLFGRLGATAFGGPAAHIAIMQDEVVRRRKWLSDEAFLDLLGATNLIPGPNSTEMAIHIGWARRRWAGLVVAGVSFIVPAMMSTLLLSWAYVELGSLPEAGWLMYGVKPVIVGIVAQALVTLAPKAAKTNAHRALLGLAAALALLGVNELIVLSSMGLASAWLKRGEVGPAYLIPVLPLIPVATQAHALVTLPSLFLIFLKTGSVWFGSGYVLLAFLRADFVDRLGWLTEAQLIDAVAIGQVTPGPLSTTATFIGYLLAGPTGALVATLGIFLPAFVFVALSGPLVPKIRRSPRAAAFLEGVSLASLALMAVVTVQLGRAALVDVPSVILALASVVVLVRLRVNSTWLILAGATIGFAIHP